MIKEALVYRLVDAVARPFRLRIKGAEHVPAEGPVILAANHHSYMDPIFVWLVSRRLVFFLAKEELFKVPILSFTIRKFGTIPLRRKNVDKTALDEAIRRLKAGKIIGIFPQGSRQESINTEESFSGVGLLAARGEAPVIPVKIIGSEKIWKGGLFPLRFQRVRVVVGEPQYYDKAIYDRESFSRKVMEEIRKLSWEEEKSLKTESSPEEETTLKREEPWK